MTPVFMYEGKKIVRTNSNVATPFLRSLEPHVKELSKRITRDPIVVRPRALDIGCGNGRNSTWAIHRGFEVKSCDMYPSFEGSFKWDLNDGVPPFFYQGSVNLVLLQYVTMFLPDFNRQRVATEALLLCAKPGIVVLEMQEVKNGLMDKQSIGRFVERFEDQAKGERMTVIGRAEGKIAVALN